MRGPVLLSGVVLGALISTACSKAKDSQPAPAGAPRGSAVTGPGGAITGGSAATGGPEGAVVPSPGATGPDPSFELALVAPAAVAAAAPATARLVVHPGPGMKMNVDFPTGLTLTPPAGVTLSKTSLVVADAEKFDTKELAFAVTMSAAAPGEYKVPGIFKFAVCDEGACYPKKRAVELTHTVR